MKRLGMGIVVLLLAGCAPQKQLSREEWLAVYSRQYDGMPAASVFKAAEQLFALADGKDTKFSYTENSMKAIRWTAPFPVHVWYHWDILSVENSTGTNVNVSISTTAAGFLVPGSSTPYESPDVASLFFSRIDYLLGRSDAWYSCDAYKAKFPKHTSLEALCLLASDEVPKPSVAQSR